MVHNKLLKVTSASNKSISQGKFINIVNDATNAHWGVMWQGVEQVKAFIVLIYATYSLFEMFSWACFLPFVFTWTKMAIDIYTRKFRERTWKKVGMAGDARSGEINQAFKNIKTLKLYAW
jgi:hypothetical protein